jgi:hypothetical protein
MYSNPVTQNCYFISRYNYLNTLRTECVRLNTIEGHDVPKIKMAGYELRSLDSTPGAFFLPLYLQRLHSSPVAREG